jgi:hypothetical protein
MKLAKRLFQVTGLICLFSLLAACNGSSSSTGTMSLAVNDTPVDGAQMVVVAFTGVDLMSSGNLQSFPFATERTINLLSLQGSASAQLLSGVTVPAGNYQWIRLDIDPANSYIITSTGARYPLDIPSGSQTGLKLVSGFTVDQGSQSDFLIDFNLRQSLTESNSGGTTSYLLNPALRLVNLETAGSVSGTAATTLSINGESINNTACDPAVYVYPQGTTVFNGFDVSVSGGTTPIASATLSLDSSTGLYDYTVGFLAPGTYVLALTCAGNDTSGATSLAVVLPQDVTITANTTATVNFT